MGVAIAVSFIAENYRIGKKFEAAEAEELALKSNIDAVASATSDIEWLTRVEDAVKKAGAGHGKETLRAELQKITFDVKC